MLTPHCDKLEADRESSDQENMNKNIDLAESGAVVEASPLSATAHDLLAPTIRQARRDRLRIVQAQEKIGELHRRVRALEQALSGQSLSPLYRWHRLAQHFWGGNAVAPTLPSPPPLVSSAAKRAIVIDHHWPEPDRDSGSIDIVNLVRTLGNLGFDVILAATEESGPSDARDKLEKIGIRCLGAEISGSMEAYLAANGADFDLCVLCRVYCGGAFLETVQRSCGRARIVFNSIDLNFLREQRRANVTQDEDLLAVLPQIRAREEHIIRESDATILVSDAEMRLIEEAIPDAFCLQMPLARPISPPLTPFSERQGIGFIGGFAHEPNSDAMRFFLRDIWPLVLRSLPDCRLSIVGSGLAESLLENCPGHVVYLGHVPDVAPWFESLRMTIAPLRFGAGAKGKVASSLAAGVPAVVSTVAAEGMALEGSGVLMADDAPGFAARIVQLHEDPELWERLSGEAISHARQNLSLDAWQARLAQMLLRLGF